MSIILTIMSGLLSTLISVLFTIYYNHKRKEELLLSKLESILKISVEYPYLENPEFTKQWNRDVTDERYLRYDHYCTLVFNYLEQVVKNFNYNKNKIEKFIAIKIWVRIHRENWKNPLIKDENIDGYEEKYRNLINSYLK